MKSKTIFFSHDCHARHDEKIIRLIQKHSWNGYGLFWALAEKLYENKGQISEDYATLSFDLRAEEEVIKDIVNGFDLFYIKEGFIRSKSCDKRMAVIANLRISGRHGAEKRWHGDSQPTTTPLAINETKQEEKKPDLFTPQAKEIVDFFNQTLNKRLSFNQQRRSIIATKLREGKTIEQLKQAITNFSKDDWADRHKFCDIVYCLGVRNKIDNYEKWINWTPQQKQMSGRQYDYEKAKQRRQEAYRENQDRKILAERENKTPEQLKKELDALNAFKLDFNVAKEMPK